MSDGAYAWYVGTLRDGRITTQIDTSTSGSSWSAVMDDADQLSTTMPLSDPDVAALNPYLIAEPCRCFLAVAYIGPGGDETFLAGGPIWTHRYDGGTKQLTIGAAGVWSYYDHRKVLPVLAAGVSPASVTTAVVASLATVAKRLVQLAHTHTAGSLPIVLPSDEAGALERDYPGSAMTNIGQALRDLAAEEGGPEIQFVPRRRTDDPRFLEWVMRVGTAAAPLLVQVGADWVWDHSAVESSVTELGVVRDGSAMATRAWVQGSGTDTTTLFGRADATALTNVGFPLLETQTSGQETVTAQAKLDSAARAGLATVSRPSETWSVKVRRDDEPRVGSYRVGNWVSITLGGDPYLPDGTYRTRITSVSGDDSAEVSLGLAPTLGGV